MASIAHVSVFSFKLSHMDVCHAQAMEIFNEVKAEIEIVEASVDCMDFSVRRSLETLHSWSMLCCYPQSTHLRLG